MKDKRQILQDAIGTGEVIKIRYHGGSQPGAVREIVPRKIDGEYLKAICLNNEELRAFRIDKIEIASEDEEITYDKDFKGFEKNFEVKCSICRKTYIISKTFSDEINAKKFEQWLYSQDEHHCKECFLKLEDGEIISEILNDEKVKARFLKTFKKNPIANKAGKSLDILPNSPVTLEELKGNAISSSILNNKKLETDIRNLIKRKYPDFDNVIIETADLYNKFKKYLSKYGYDVKALRSDYIQKLLEIIFERIKNKLEQQSIKEPVKETPKKAEPPAPEPRNPEIISPKISSKKPLLKFAKIVVIILIVILSFMTLICFLVVCDFISKGEYATAIVGIIFTSPFAIVNYKLIKKLKK